MSFKNFRIGTRLSYGFGLMFVLTLIVGVLAFYELLQLSELTVNIYRHPFTVTKALRDIRINVIDIDNYIKSLQNNSDRDSIDSVVHTIEEHEQNVQELFHLVSQRFLGEESEIKSLKASFDLWIRHLKEIKEQESMTNTDYYARIKKESQHYIQSIDSKIQPMIVFADNKALSFLETAKNTRKMYSWSLLAILTMAGTIGFFISFYITRGIVSPLDDVVRSMKQLARGDVREDLEMNRHDELGELAISFNDIKISMKEKIYLADRIAQGKYDIDTSMFNDIDALGQSLNAMAKALRNYAYQSDLENWFKTGRNELSARLVGEHGTKELGDVIIRFLASYLDAQIGALYVLQRDQKLHILASYAFDKRKELSDVFEIGQGFVGQAALEKKLISITSIPDNYIRINSALGNTHPQNIVVVPVLHEGEVKAIIELGSFNEFSDEKIEFLNSVNDYIGITFHTVENQSELRDLLDQSRIQSHKLQTQQEELRAVNEELEQQAGELRSSEEELQSQQEELRISNADLESKNTFLEKQQAEIHLKNIELENIRKGLEEKARELELSTKYKSEFLANMSHELRTPLNSLLLLSRSLMENEQGNLDSSQVEYAHVIYNSGNDLLALINDILDLSKIESGKMSVHIEEFSIASFSDSLRSLFEPMMKEKGLEFHVKFDDNIPTRISSDRQRVDQILRNLLSNAVKFSDAGSIDVHFYIPKNFDFNQSDLEPGNTLAIAVRDTGIGIPPKDLDAIFEAFQQVDGGTARKYGGTGLGLSISRELAKRLGGKILVQSVEGQGSTFTLYLPFQSKNVENEYNEKVTATNAVSTVSDKPKSSPQYWKHKDDRNDIDATKDVILIIEDDPAFAQILLDICHSKGFLGIVSSTGEEGLQLVKSFLPQGIILDLGLPGIGGLDVLDTLKEDQQLRHIPVHIVSSSDGRKAGLRKGAIGFLTKPASREGVERVFEQLTEVMKKDIKDLLIIEDDTVLRQALANLIASPEVQVHEVETGKKALEALSTHTFDCIILDLGLPDMSGFDLLNQFQALFPDTLPPIIVYTGKEINKEKELALRDHAESIIIKGAKSEERLLDEISLFLHQIVTLKPTIKQASFSSDDENTLQRKTILLVDDDMRNLFALAQTLKEKGFIVIKSEDGSKALKILREENNIDLVLLDMMMPGMDGYETAKHIRGLPHCQTLPIIALTAKAMTEDKQKCIAAGANDYLAKPVEIDQLLSVMRVWLSRESMHEGKDGRSND